MIRAPAIVLPVAVIVGVFWALTSTVSPMNPCRNLRPFDQSHHNYVWRDCLDTWHQMRDEEADAREAWLGPPTKAYQMDKYARVQRESIVYHSPYYGPYSVQQQRYVYSDGERAHPWSNWMCSSGGGLTAPNGKRYKQACYD